MSGEPVGVVDLDQNTQFKVFVDSGRIVTSILRDQRNLAGPVSISPRQAEDIADLLGLAVQVAPVIASAQAAARQSILAIEARYERIVATAIGEQS